MSRSAIIKTRLVNALREMDMPPHTRFKASQPLISAEMYELLRRLSQEAQITIITAQQRRRG